MKRDRGYPTTMPANQYLDRSSKFYRFSYQPLRSADGHINSYLVEARPLDRRCGIEISLIMAEDGAIHVTHEPRAAALTDPPIS